MFLTLVLCESYLSLIDSRKHNIYENRIVKIRGIKISLHMIDEKISIKI